MSYQPNSLTEGAALQLPEATITKPFRALRDLAHRRGYPDPADPELIGPLVEHRSGVAWHRQEATHNVLDYNTKRLHMTQGLDGVNVYDQLVEQNAGSPAEPGVASFGLRAGDVRDMEARHQQLDYLLDRAFKAGDYRMYQGAVSRNVAEEEGGWQGPYPTQKQARRDARASTRTAEDQRIGLFAA